MSSQNTQKRPGFYGKIETKEDALKVIKDTSKLNIFRWFTIYILCCLLLLGQTIPTQAQQGRDPALEQEISARLTAINPQAVPIFEQATSSMDTEDYEAARAGFEKVLKLAPDFPDALRRLSHVEIRLTLLDEALAHAQKAFDVDPSALNKVNLASVLLSPNTPASNLKAYNLSREAIQELPEDVYAIYVLMFAAVTQNDTQTMRAASEKLIRLQPEDPGSHFSYALVMAQDGKWEKAEAEMLTARELGYPAEDIDQTLQEIGISSQARIYRTVRWTGYLVGAWLAGMLILFVAGLALNKMTLAAVRRAESSLQTQPSRSEARVRSIYRAVIGLTSVYFYISIPFIILLVIAIGGGLIYFFSAIGIIPGKLVWFIAVSVLYTLYAVIRSIFTRFKQDGPGRPLSKEEAPALWQLTGDIADQLQTPPIQAIYLTPGTEVAVYEQGGMLRKARGQGKRILLLGLGILPGMTQGQLKSILAHEYGHFTRKDTAGGDIAYQAQRSMDMMALGLTRTGQARWYNPAWLFLNGFYRVFLRITLGASRLQEILADRYAAIAFGAQNFIAGLSHVIRQSITFDFQVNHNVEQAVENKTPLTNLYSLPVPPVEETAQKLDEAIEKAFNRPSSAFDSHPSPTERYRLVEALRLQEEATGPGDDQPAWELFPNAESLQDEMTAQVQVNLNEQMQDV